MPSLVVGERSGERSFGGGRVGGEERCGLGNAKSFENRGDVGTELRIIGFEHRQEWAIDERVHELDGGKHRCTALWIGFASDCFERGGGPNLAGGGEVVAGDRANFERWVGELTDERGDALGAIGGGAGGGHGGFDEGGRFGLKFLRACDVEHSLRTELGDDRDPLIVRKVQLGEVGHHGLGELGPAKIDEQENRLDVIARFFARSFEHSPDGRVGFEGGLNGLGIGSISGPVARLWSDRRSSGRSVGRFCGGWDVVEGAVFLGEDYNRAD